MPRVKLFDETEVLNKAMNLFWEQGYSATSIQELVTCLGINRASLYSTFGDKQQLFKKALAHYKKINTEGLTAFFQANLNVKKGFSKLFEIAIDQAINDTQKKGCFVVNTTTELIPGDDKILFLLEENKKMIETLFYNYLKQGKESDQFEQEKDLKTLASLLFTLYNGIRVVSKINPNKKNLSNTINLALTLLD